jgi:hypothetical protein
MEGGAMQRASAACEWVAEPWSGVRVETVRYDLAARSERPERAPGASARSERRGMLADGRRQILRFDLERVCGPDINPNANNHLC